jgi:hypothetical protein
MGAFFCLGGGATPMGTSSSADDDDGLPVLLLIDELQILYSRAAALSSSLYAIIKRLAQGLPSRVRILAAAVFGDAPSHASDRGSGSNGSIATPFEYSPDQLVSFFPGEGGGPTLALTRDESKELWSKFWEGHPLGARLFVVDSDIEDTVFKLTSGQVIWVDMQFFGHNCRVALQTMSDHNAF